MNFSSLASVFDMAKICQLIVSYSYLHLRTVSEYLYGCW